MLSLLKHVPPSLVGVNPSSSAVRVVVRCISQSREWFNEFMVVVTMAVKLTGCEFEGGRGAIRSLLQV